MKVESGPRLFGCGAVAWRSERPVKSAWLISNQVRPTSRPGKVADKLPVLTTPEQLAAQHRHAMQRQKLRRLSAKLVADPAVKAALWEVPLYAGAGLLLLAHSWGMMQNTAGLPPQVGIPSLVAANLCFLRLQRHAGRVARPLKDAAHRQLEEDCRAYEARLAAAERAAAAARDAGE